MKLYLEPIHVTPARDGWPADLMWRGTRYVVAERQEKWLYGGKWWTTPGLVGIQRRYYRVTTNTPAGSVVVMEVYEEAGSWVLSRVLD